MYITAVANEKGGVAKTTTTVSLGAALVEHGFKVLLVDLDAQSNLTLALGINPKNIELSIANLFIDSTPIEKLLINTEFERLDLLPSNKKMGMAERFLPIHQGYEYFLRNALSPLKDQYDIVLIDCPPYLGAVTKNAFVTANLLLVPTQAEYFSIYALRNIMDTVSVMRRKHNPQLTYRLLLTMFDKRNKTHRIMHEQLRNNFGTGMLETFISIDTKLRESSIAGTPIIYHTPRSRAAKQYLALAQEMTKYVKETTALQSA